MTKRSVIFSIILLLMFYGCDITEVKLTDKFMSSDDKISVVITQDMVMRIYTGVKDKGNVKFRINEGDIDTLKSIDVRIIRDREEYKLEGVRLIRDE